MPRRSDAAPKPPGIRRILIRCSVTAKLIDSGRTIEEDAFKSLRLGNNNKVSCGHCGKVHQWAKEDVVLAR